MPSVATPFLLVGIFAVGALLGIAIFHMMGGRR